MAKRKATAKLDSEMAKRESGKSQAKIGDIRQLRVKFEQICTEEIVARSLIMGETNPDLSYSDTLMKMHERIEQRCYKALRNARKEINGGSK